MKKSKTIVEHSINEWALVNKPFDSLYSDKYKIYVYGNDRGNFTPHFHFFDNEKSFHVEIPLLDIDNLTILKSLPRQGIPKNRLLTWDGLTKEKKMLQNWLQEKSSKIKNHTNKEDLIVFWNGNNPDNEIETYI